MGQYDQAFNAVTAYYNDPYNESMGASYRVQSGVRWTSSDTSIATINATTGLITPIKEGEVKFTATSIGLGYTGKYITYESGIVQILEDTAIPKVRMESKEDMVQIFDTQASADEREAEKFPLI